MIITISRQFGAGGAEVAKRVADRLHWRVADNEFIDRIASEAGLTPDQVAAREERVPNFIERLAWALASASAEAGGTHRCHDGGALRADAGARNRERRG